MTKNVSLTLIAVICAGLGLAGCQSVKQELGVGRHSPDEFTVVKRAPLTLPPDYSLRVPATGAAPPAAIASNQAKTIVLGSTEQEPATTGSAEEQMLRKMGAQNARADIRDVISEENGVIAIENQKAVDKLMFWSDKEPGDESLPVSKIDAKKEAERLKKAQEEGAPINSGEVPTIEPKKSTIDKIF